MPSDIFANPIIYFLTAAVLIVMSLSVHEFAHAFAADSLGDSTPRLMGRLTLNPVAHWDPIGTTLLVGLVLLQSLGLPVVAFGWGKPVVVDDRHFENPLLDNLAVSLAGPGSNFILAVIFGGIIRFVQPGPIITEILFLAVLFNLILMVFNLIPIPPLDGSKILALFLPENLYVALNQYGTFLLFLLIFFSPFVTGYIIRVVTFLFSLITGQTFSLS